MGRKIVAGQPGFEERDEMEGGGKRRDGIREGVVVLVLGVKRVSYVCMYVYVVISQVYSLNSTSATSAFSRDKTLALCSHGDSTSLPLLFITHNWPPVTLLLHPSFFYLPIYHTYTHIYTYTHALATFPLLLPIRSLIHVPHKLAPDFLPSPSLLPKPPSQRHPRSNRQIF